MSNVDLFIDNNESILQNLDDGKYSDKEEKEAVGSFMMVLFQNEYWEAIPLFFYFLSHKTGRDYSDEIEWVSECLEAGQKSYESFTNDPMRMLFAALLSCKE